MTKDYRDSHFDLYQLFGGYLNQSWIDIYIWEGKKPSYQPLIRKYKTEDTQEGIDKTIAQLKDIMKIGKGMSEDDFSDSLYLGLSLGYYPPGDDLTHEQWLEDVLKILEEPMEETLKHWIPKRI
jgi:CdiI immunity protein